MLAATGYMITSAPTKSRNSDPQCEGHLKAPRQRLLLLAGDGVRLLPLPASTRDQLLSTSSSMFTSRVPMELGGLTKISSMSYTV